MSKWEFGDWWKQVNDLLAEDGFDIRFGDARYFYNLNYTPICAASEHRTQVLEQRLEVYMVEALLDMWCGNHNWRDPGVPLEMDVMNNNPSYLAHLELVEITESYRRRQPRHW